MTINTQTDFRQLPLDSQSFVWQAGEIFRLPSGEQFRIEQPLKSTVFLAVDLVAINKNAIASTELERGRQAILRKDPRCIIKLAAADEFMLMSDADKATAAARLAKEQFLLEKLQGPRVPQLLEAWDSNCLLNPEFNVRRPSPPFLILEYVDGQSLRELVSSDDLTQRAAQLADVWQLLQDAVASLEQAGVLHRDLNPDNMRVRSQQLVLFDFGCASCDEFTSLEKAQTPFNAPEVRRGSQSQNSDHYSLAALSYWLFTGNEPDQLQRSTLADVFQPLAKFWQQAMASEPAERYGSLAELDNAFKQALAEFIRELNPVAEALARQQQLRAQHTEFNAEVAALGEQITELGQQLSELSSDAPVAAQDSWLEFKDSVQRIAEAWHQVEAHQKQLQQQLSDFAAVLTTQFTGPHADVIAKEWLLERKQDPLWPEFIGALAEQLNMVCQESLLYQLENQLRLPAVQVAQQLLSSCNQLLADITASVQGVQLSSLQKNILANINREVSQHQLRFDELAAALNEATPSLKNLADVIRLKSRRQQLWQQQQRLVSNLADVESSLKQLDLHVQPDSPPGYPAQRANWPLRLGAVAVLTALGVIVWPTIQESIKPARAELVSALVRGEAGEVQLIANKPWAVGNYQFTVGTTRCEPRGVATQTLTFNCLVNESGNLSYQLANNEGLLQKGMLKVSAQSHLLNVNVTPANATVALNQQQVKTGTRLAEGEYQLSVKAEGYQALTKTIQFTGQPLQLSLELLSASLTVQSETPNLQLQLKGANNSQRLNAGESISLPLGDYELTASAEHYQSQTQKVSLTSNQQLSINLEPMRYSLNLNITPANASVFVNDVKVTLPLQLLAGEYQLRVEAAGYQSYSEVLAVDNNSRKTLSLNAIPKPAAPTVAITQVAAKPVTEANQVPFIHGWSPEQVKALQQQAAKAVGKSVFFQEPLINGQGLGPKMAVIPAGSFLMGCSEGDTECAENEKPDKHKVTHAKHFAASQYEITFADWALCVSQGGCQAAKNPDAHGWGRDKRPVIYVNLDDVSSYLKWLSKATGGKYRLLAESEWEYAARAGSTLPYAQFGYCIDSGKANYDNKYSSVGVCPLSKAGPSLFGTETVGKYPANSFGLFDMLNNVSEFTSDCYQDNLTLVPRNGAAFYRPNCKAVVIRGGSWRESSDQILVSYRYYHRNDWDNNVGFRVALDL
jgi:formylglycine-generating enzyme required for sulfatase activity/serine/threonine protein kinase